MECNVLVYDPYIYSETIRGSGYEPVGNLDEALARADFVTIHCPKTPETIGLFNAARLARMKPTAYLVNTARGGIVDEKALHDVLAGRRIAGAALDVFDQEPTPADNPCRNHYTEVVMNTLLEAGQSATKELKRMRWALVSDSNPWPML